MHQITIKLLPRENYKFYIGIVAYPEIDVLKEKSINPWKQFLQGAAMLIPT